jgi:hypothetical protein
VPGGLEAEEVHIAGCGKRNFPAFAEPSAFDELERAARFCSSRSILDRAEVAGNTCSCLSTGFGTSKLRFLSILAQGILFAAFV